MPRPPVLFVSHGSPELAVRETPAHRFLKELGAQLDRPRAILMISAHWETNDIRVGASSAPETIYDFGGFDPRLREIVYPAPAAPGVARAVSETLADNGLKATDDPTHGYDHGVWVPLHLLFPDAEVPLAQISIQPHRDPDHHFRIGQALRSLRDDGVMIIASGAMTHNLRAFVGQAVEAAAPEWVAEFNEWFAAKLAAGDVDALLDYRNRAPFAKENHPSDEHLLPIFSALGASHADEPHARVHESYEHGVLSMDVYRFG